MLFSTGLLIFCRGISRTTKIMKKFNVEKIVASANGESRLGSLRLGVGEDSSTCSDDSKARSDMKAEETVFKTPMYLIHTQTGSVPHVTPEVLEMIYASGSGPKPPVQMSLSSTLKFAESLKKFGKGVGKFVGLAGQPAFLTLHDPLHNLRLGHNDKFGIAMWSRHGRTSLTPKHFTDVLPGFKVPFCQIISDYDVQPGTSGVKRLKKSLSRAEEYTAHVLEQQPGKFENTGLLVTIEAAWFEMDEILAKKTVMNLLESQQRLEGVVIAGISDRFKISESSAPSNGKQASRALERVMICDNVNLELVEKIISILPKHLLKYVPGPFRLPHMVDLISKGVDLFDSSVASRMADDGEVFVVDMIEDVLPTISEVNSLSPVPTESLPERENEEGPVKVDVEKLALLPLKDKRFFDDFRPVSGRCSCYTCRKHTRSYIHHLYATDELLGPVLVQIHNLTALDQFFKIIRKLLQECEAPESLSKKLELIKTSLQTTNTYVCTENMEDNIESSRMQPAGVISH